MLVLTGNSKGCKMFERTVHGNTGLWPGITVLQGAYLLWNNKKSDGESKMGMGR